MKYFSMFSGIGGFEYGIEKGWKSIQSSNKVGSLGQNRGKPSTDNCNGAGWGAYTNGNQPKNEGYEPQINSECDNIQQLQRTSISDKWECVGYSEIDKYAIATYKKHFPTHKNYGDATKINPSELPDFDLLCSGFPCQSFSIAGKREGFGDTRGTLFFEIARIIEVKKPKYLFLENVKGLLSAPLVDEQSNELKWTKGYCFATILQRLAELGYDVQWFVLNSKFFGVPQNRERVFIIGNLRGEPCPEILPFREIYGETKELVYAQKSDREIARVYSTEGIAPSLYLKTGGWQEPKIQVAIKAEFQKTAYDSDGISPTVRDGHGDVVRIGVSDRNLIRRLTPLECERLQGFPDNWTEGISDTQRYRQLGNAVTTNVVEVIIRNWKRGNNKWLSAKN